MDDDDIQLRAGLNKLKNESRHKECFHANSDCTTKIIKAHSIQHSKILTKVSEKGNVLIFSLSYDKWSFELNKTGKAKASTFSGFCNKHDKEIFSPIENFNFAPNNKEQEFLYAYRALAIAYNHKYSEKLLFQKLLVSLEKGTYKKYGLIVRDMKHCIMQKLDYRNRLKFINIALKQREKTKMAFNKNLDNKRFDSIVTLIIIVPDEYLIAASSMLFIMKDFNGNIVNNIVIPKAVHKPLFLSIFPQDGKTYILMSFLKRQRNYFSWIADNLMKEDAEQQQIMLSKLIIKYSDNFVLSPATWNNLSSDEKNKINGLLMTSLSINTDISSMPDVNLFF